MSSDLNKVKPYVIVGIILGIISVSSVIVLSNGVTFGQVDETNQIEINDFSNFQQHLDNEMITSQHSSDEISFEYEEKDLVDDVYLATFDDYGNCTDFSINLTIDYEYEGGSSILGTAFLRLGSYYAEDGSSWDLKPEKGVRSNDSYSYLCTLSVRDVWTASGGLYRIVGHQNDVKDTYEETSSFPLSGSVNLFASREGNEVTCEIQKSTGELLLSHTWTYGITKPLNYIVLQYYMKSGYGDYCQVEYKQIKSFFSISPNEIEISFNDYTSFELWYDSPTIISKNEGTFINFIYDKTGQYEGDTYIYMVSNTETVHDFSVNVTVDFNYSEPMLGAALFRLGSYYRENGSEWGIPIKKGERITDAYNFLSTLSVRDVWESSIGTYRLVGLPFDEKDPYENPLGQYSGTLIFSIMRTDNLLNARISNVNGVILLNHTWTEGVSRGINYIVIDYYLFVKYADSTRICFRDLQGSFTLEIGNDGIFLTPWTGILINLGSIMIVLKLKKRRSRTNPEKKH